MLLAVVLERPLVLSGAAGIGAVLVVSQATTVSAFTDTDDSLDVEYTLSQSRVAVDDTMFVTMSAQRPTESDVAVTVTAQPPLAADPIDESERQLRLAPGTTSATTSFEMTVPLAGRVELSEPTVTLADRQGLFKETYQRGPTETLTVEPRTPRDIHIGQGGDRMLAAYGDHPQNQSGAGLTPAGLRQYLPGDALNRIDWKATARQASPYIREFEVEAERTTLLIVDQRAAMGVGPTGRTMLDFTREVGLGLVQSAAEYNDALGLYGVGDDGLTVTRAPTATSAGYQQIRRALHELEPTRPESQSPDTETTAHPAAARRALRLLSMDDSVLSERISPFLDASDAYVQRIQGDPLFEAVRRAQMNEVGQTWTMILTNDSNRDQLRETARIASKRGHSVLIFLTPAVLFEERSLATRSETHQRYVSFEEFRRELHGLPRVTTFEVGPSEQLKTILNSESVSPPSESSS
ncbi:DUF58 domain-containing protein [Halogranum rubrum]|uniref:DUF58 domain-containing protein n=1 Tax=Halogranum rubrum TaxID=553466 RepID=UPI0015A6D5C0|nr:DUF58 domain-containing protein [Halogranum rubrum]